MNLVKSIMSFEIHLFMYIATYKYLINEHKYVRMYIAASFQFENVLTYLSLTYNYFVMLNVLIITIMLYLCQLIVITCSKL